MFLQCLVLILFILLIADRWKLKKHSKLHQQLGNDWTYVPIIGNGIQFLGNSEDTMNTFIQMTMQAYKRIHNTMSFWAGNQFFILTADADQACAILKLTLDKSFAHTFVKHVVGNGVGFAPVEIWHRKRKVLGSTFASRHVNKFVKVFEEQSKVTADLLESKTESGNISCFDYFCPYALDSLCETLFGVNVDMQRQPGHPFFEAFTEAFKIVASRIRQPWLYYSDMIFKLLPFYARKDHTTKIIHEYVDNFISKNEVLINSRESILKRKETYENHHKSNVKSILELMMDNSKDTEKTYTNEELRDEAIVVGLAGNETTATGICFTILLLSQYTDVQNKVYSEIREVLGDSDKGLYPEDLQKLKYTRAVIKESLRLYPPVPFISRHCEKDIELPSGLVLERGCNPIVSIWGIQRNPQYWGKDANDFNPERFMSGEIATTNAFMAFSHGPRNCVGQQYAMLSMTITLVTMLRRYRFTPATNFKYDKNNPLRLYFDLQVKHVDNFPVQVHYRDIPISC